MKILHKWRLLLLFVGALKAFDASSQTDKTSLITNPSFETGNYTGWTWTGRTGGWQDVNTDGDGTKDGSYIAGYWNGSIGDVECSQTLTGLPNGYYRVTALATVSTGRSTLQRLFANGKSVLYGAIANPAYSAANLAILGATETYAFGGYAESGAENGPFQKLSVVAHVTDGTLKLGFRTNGKSTALGYNFTYTAKGDAGFFKFDNFTLTEVSNAATLDNISLSTGALNTAFNPNVTTYTATLPVGTTTVTPNVVAVADGQTITGAGAVDVSGGSGSSVITVKSVDGTATKTYTINYTVLQQSYINGADGVQFFVPGGSMKVRVCTDKIFQVSYSNQAAIPAKDTIIVNKVWGDPAYTVTESGDLVTITTASLKATVSKTTFLVGYYDLNGNLILSENAKSVTPATIKTTNFTTETNACSATFNSPVTEALYGLGQHQAGVMNYKGKTQSLDEQNCEVALPFMVSSLGYGILWDNYSYSNFRGDMNSNTQYQFYSESGKMVDYYFMYGPELDSVIANYRTASGKAPLFPKWAYGLFMSKDKYNSSDELLGMVNQYRKAGIPLDCIVQDWDYWSPDYWGSHTMYPARYPDPKALLDSLHQINAHAMISVWPLFHSSTANYQEFKAIGGLYPSDGEHHFYDPHNEAARKIFWNQVNSQLFSKYGWDAWWADNDEPAGYPDGFDRKDFMTGKGAGATYYNTFPIQHTAGFYDGWRTDITDKRVFALSRSAFSGQQRYGTAVWSGDIVSTWDSYQRQLSGGLNFCLSGMPYWTTDIGGYWSTNWTLKENQELMTRWFQYGTFCPIFRVHGKGDRALVSNQSFSQSTIDNLVKFDKLRYRLMPYIYSLGWKVTNEDYTMMRHLVMDYRTDNNVKAIDNQFLFGPALMVNPVTTLGAIKRDVYMPAGIWYDFWNGQQVAGAQTISADAPLDRIPIYVKAGSILPMGPDIMYANQSVDPLEIRVYKGADGRFTLYEDEGDTYNYEKGQYSEIPFTYNDHAKQLVIGQRKGSFNKMLVNRTIKVVLVGENYGAGLNAPIVFDSIVHYNGSEAVVTFGAQPVAQTHYEAESATLSGGAKVASTQTGFSGTGYVTGMNLSHASKVTFTVTVPQTGLYALKLRYSSDSVYARRTLLLNVNQDQADSVKCVGTRDWSTWATATSIVNLVAGANSVSYIADSAYVNPDCLDITTPSSQPYYQVKSRICRIRQLNGSKYITAKESAVVLAGKDVISKSQYFRIDKLGADLFKLTSLADGKSMTVSNASLSENAKVVTTADENSAAQRWTIDDFGSNVFKLTAQNSLFCLSVGATDTLVQQSSADRIGQRWVFEDSVKVINSAYEPFDYTQGSSMVSMGEAGDGWGGPWTVYDGLYTDMTITAPTAYTGLSTTGNKLTGSLSTASAVRAYRELSPRWSDDGKNIWISFLMEINNPDKIAGSWQGLSLFNGDAERVLIGKNWGRTVLGINGADASEGLSTVSALNLNPSWIVVKIETSGNSSNENAYLWINPDPKSEPQTTKANVKTAVQINNGFDRIVCHLGNTAGISTSYDEIRIGKSFNAVTSPVATGMNSAKADDAFTVTVNNASKTAKVNFTSTESGNGVISLYDISGRALYQKAVDVLADHNEYLINANKLGINAGIYFVTLRTGGSNYSAKIAIP